MPTVPAKAPDALLIEPRLCLGQLRRGLLEVRPGAIILALGKWILPYQFLVALKIAAAPAPGWQPGSRGLARSTLSLR